MLIVSAQLEIRSGNIASAAYCSYGLTYLLTYLLTPWSRVLLEKLTGSAASQETPRLFGT